MEIKQVYNMLYTVLVESVGCLFCSITTTNFGLFSKPGTDLKSAGPDVSKTPPTCAIWPSFGRDIWG